MAKQKLIIGLGNPDPQYETTYHNMGYFFVDYLIKIRDPRWKIEQIFKTDVYMNKSGEFVKKLLREKQLKPEQTLIIHDDSDIALGEFKFSFNRSSAGHRGVQNIIDQLKTQSFWRLRIGIRPLKNKNKAEELVLKKITPARLKILETVFKEALIQLKNI